MLMFILETSTEKGCLILAKNGVPVEVVDVGGGPELSKNLAAKSKALLSDIPDLIAVGTGPGSYTGIRVGVALAQSLAYGWKIPLIGFCSLSAFGPPPVLVDAKSGGFYALLEREPELISPSDPRLQKFPCIRSPHPEIIQKRLTIPGQVQESRVDPSYLAPLVYRQFLEKGAAPLELIYLSSP